MPCFLAGNHKDHDYKISKSSGGMCDCGDPLAWKRSGFCSKHTGAKEDLNPEDLIPPVIVAIASQVLRSVAILLDQNIDHYLLCEREAPERKVFFERLLEILNWLLKLQTYGEAFKNIIAKQLGNEVGTIGSPLTKLIQNHGNLPNAIRLKAHELYSQLIVDLLLAF
jgi:E3 ubiquitin-protein ligase UBR3